MDNLFYFLKDLNLSKTRDMVTGPAKALPHYWCTSHLFFQIFFTAVGARALSVSRNVGNVRQMGQLGHQQLCLS